MPYGANKKRAKAVAKNPLEKQAEGPIRTTARGEGSFFLPEGKSAIISSADLAKALDGDTVSIAYREQGQDIVGKVLKIIKRKRDAFVGTLEKAGEGWQVKPDDRRLYIVIAIEEKNLAGAKSDDKVLAEITDWPNLKDGPSGKIIKVIGQTGQHNAEMESIILDNGFTEEFNPEIEQEAISRINQLHDNFNKETVGRRDFRAITTLTIDPVDAKDYDDAISFQEVAPDRFEVGVHIADVSYFVRPGTGLDDEARHRATSIYLVDRTISMLPEVLSNGECSLVEGKDRLTFSGVFTLDKTGKIHEEWFGRSLINSNRRFTYEQVQKILDDKAGAYFEELNTLNKLAYALRKRKIEAGALSFEDEEVRFRLDADGKPIDITKKERTDSHKLVEDFMLLANKKVAEYVSKLNKNQPKTFVYRIHDSPDPAKILALREFLKPLGYDVKIGGKKITSVEFNRLLVSALGQPEEAIVHRAAIRAMPRAIYSTQNIGHYGLAFPHYTHFTSPIRRYPDLMVHRLLDIYLSGQKPSQELLNEYSSLAIHCSEREKQASNAERDSVKYKQVEYLSEKIGKIYDGIISEVTDWGIFVEERETKAEGLVRFSDLADDYYRFDKKKYAVIGQKTKKAYRLGDAVKIKVMKTDQKRRIIDFKIIG